MKGIKNRGSIPHRDKTKYHRSSIETIMDHPQHDDSHLPDPIENSDENIERLCEVMVDKMQESDWREYAWDALEKEFSKDFISFRESWKEHMESP